MAETSDKGRQPEPPAMFDSDMAAYLAGLKGARKEEVQGNIEQMKRWAGEGK